MVKTCEGAEERLTAGFLLGFDPLVDNLLCLPEVHPNTGADAPPRRPNKVFFVLMAKENEHETAEVASRRTTTRSILECTTVPDRDLVAILA